MDTFKNTSEIVEVLEELDPVVRSNNESANNYHSDAKRSYSIEDDINHLFQAFNNKNSGRSSAQKSGLKRPIGAGSVKVSGIGISGPVNLKQALRGLCISQAAEMAAMKRLSRPAEALGVSEAVTIERLHGAVVVEAGGSGASLDEAKGKLVEVSIIPERMASRISNEMSESIQKSRTEEEEKVGEQQYAASSSNDRAASDEISSSLTDFSSKSSVQGKKMGVCHSAASHSSSNGSAKISKSHGNSPSLIKPIFQAKSFVTKKAMGLTSLSIISKKIAANAESGMVLKTFEMEKQINDCISTHERKESKKA